MKKIKIISTIVCITLFVIFASAMSVCAKNYTNKNMGISFDLADSWEQANQNDSLVSYTHKFGYDEHIEIGFISSSQYELMNIEDLGTDALKEICDEMYSNYNLSQNIVNASTGAKAKATITSDGEPLTAYETHNNTAYFRYEKAYTASGAGYYNAAFYTTCYLTVKGGAIYFYGYTRQTTSNNFKEFVNMLDSIVYDNVIKITVNGSVVYPDRDPFIAYDRTLVPIRAIAEKMGYTVGWNSEYQLVTLTSSDGAVNLYFGIGDYTALKIYANKTDMISLDVPPVVVGGRTYLPVRAVAEAMNANVNWNGNTKTVEISY